MSARRYITILVTGALVFAAPVAIAESPLGTAPHGSEPAASEPSSPPIAQTSEPASVRPAVQHPSRPHRSASTRSRSVEPGGAVEPEQTLEPDAGAAPEQTPEPDAGGTPGPAAEPGARATPNRSQEHTGAATPEPTPQVPASPSQTTGDGGAPCSLTSAGLICPGNPDCILTSAGVSCASGCTVTSAGISCPTGGEVSPGKPISGPPKKTRRRTPAVKVKSEREAKSEGKVSPTTVARFEETGGLPFTGAPVFMPLLLGFALLAGGLVLRRRTSTPSAAVELSTTPQPIAVLPGQSWPAPRPPSRWALLLPSLAVLACGMLLFSRKRR